MEGRTPSRLTAPGSPLPIATRTSRPTPSLPPQDRTHRDPEHFRTSLLQGAIPTAVCPGQRGCSCCTTSRPGVSPPLRSGAHVPLREADPRLDYPETPYSRGRGPLDLDPDRRSHPAPARPAPRRGPPQALGETHRLRPAHPGPGPPGVQEHPRSPRLPDPCSQTQRSRPRTATWCQEQAPGTPLRRRQNRQTPRDPQGHRQAWQVLVDKEQAECLCLNPARAYDVWHAR